MNHLFVYGTLRSACDNPHARLLAQQATLLGSARVPGRLYHLGRYPGMQLSGEPHEWVIGEVYALADPARTLALLDDYEGAEFTRVTSTAALDSGPMHPVCLYVYNRPLSESQRLPSGNYLAP